MGVSMAAFVGYCVTKAGIFFPGAIDLAGTKFSDLGTDPFAAWDAVPYYGKAQLIAWVGALEFLAETSKPHYMRGGQAGKVDTIFFAGFLTPYKPRDNSFWYKSEEKRTVSLEA